MNIGLILIWAIVVILLLVVIYVAYRAMRAWITGATVILPNVLTPCVRAFDQLPQLDGVPCCYIGATLTASRYLPSLDMVVNPVAVNYQPVCAGFCTQGLTSDGSNCLGPTTDQQEYQRCLQLAKPVQCTDPSMPVAALGATYFYPQAARNYTCQDQRPC